jgi:serine/threonine protein kinase
MAAQIGGRLIAKGVYGCVYEPLPFCADGPVFKKDGLVGKITDRSIDHELGAGRVVMNLPGASEYFAVPFESCRPALPLADRDAGKCTVLKEADDKESIRMLIMPKAGVELSRWSLNRSRMMENFVPIFRHILQGIKLYHSAGYVHNDLHYGNILVEASGDRFIAKIIDFGLAFRIQDVHEWKDTMMSQRFSPKNDATPPEVYLWRMLLNRVKNKDGTYEVVPVSITKGTEELLEANQALHERIHYNPRPLKETMLSMSSMKEIRNKDVRTYMQKYGRKIDSWRIGITMWLIRDELIRAPGYKHSVLYRQEHDVRKLLAGLLQFDVRTRFSADEALALMEKMI